MHVKQKNLLKKEVIKRSADIRYMRDAANIGDTVRVPMLRENPLLGGYIRDGRKLVEGVIINKELIAPAGDIQSAGQKTDRFKKAMVI
ncbi:hypothetical protein MHH56_07250 [Paenibacillus sp. FSL K6-3182]|uniref:hypothetical protein n=2 Tax=unclassified Paenibacillus TaxID=185978 RepID=UPI0030D2EA6D